MNTIRRAILATIVLALAYLQNASAHKEWVHQYIVKEAYKLLKNELPGQSFPNLESFLGKDFLGSGDQDFFGHSIHYWPWHVTNSIVVGAYAEDLEDLVYRYQSNSECFGCGWFDGWTASTTHFWNADRGDDALTLVPLSHDAPNAWKKTRMYFFGEREDPDFGLWMPFGNRILTSHGVFELIAFRRAYKSLCDLYSTGHERVKDGRDELGKKIDVNVQYTFGTDDRKRYVYYIFGRILHLLADMSVPAHTHDDTHACDLGDGDVYELFMGNNSAGSTCNEEHDNPSHATDWSASLCRAKGGLFTEVLSMPDWQALRYLFYTQNRVAAHFASYNQNNNLQDGGNHNVSNGTNPLIEAYYAAMGDPSNSQSSNDVTSSFSFTNAIRATATALLWFEMRMRQLDCQPILRLQDGDYFGISLPSPSANIGLFEASQMVIAGNNVYPAGSPVPTGNYTVHANAKADYRAGTQVLLQTGFSSASSSVLHAFISANACADFNDACTDGETEFEIRSTPQGLPPSQTAPTSVLDSVYPTIFVKITDSTDISGTAADTVHLSRCVQALWDTTARTDTIAIGEYAEDSSAIVLTADTIRIVFANDSLQQEIDARTKVVIQHDGSVMVYADTGSSGGLRIIPQPAKLSVYPNPLEQFDATIGYSIPTRGRVHIEVFDELGKKVDDIVDLVQQAPGSYTKPYSKLHLHSGNYYVRMQSPSGVTTTKLNIEK